MPELLGAHARGNKSEVARPGVSVIMNCYNSSRYLREAIKSVLAQTYQKWEIIFWDNQSTDESAAIFKSYADQRLRYFLAAEHTTLGQARNLAMEQARGEFIAFLDCDDLWMPRKLEKQIPLFANPAVGLVICDSLFFNGQGGTKQIYKRKKPPIGRVFRELLASYFISMETPVVRAAALETMDHWFDSRFNVIEEYDFFVRLALHWELAYVDEVLAKWRVHKGSWTWSKPELFPSETRLLLDKLRKSVANFDQDYSGEADQVLRNVAMQEALLLWRQKRNKEARRKLRDHRTEGWRFFVVYWWTWLPFPTFDAVNRIRIGF
jgi:glycosyltransferase involved in cell wall biosynthesis